VFNRRIEYIRVNQRDPYQAGGHPRLSLFPQRRENSFGDNSLQWPSIFLGSDQHPPVSSVPTEPRAPFKFFALQMYRTFVPKQLGRGRPIILCDKLPDTPVFVRDYLPKFSVKPSSLRSDKSLGGILGSFCLPLHKTSLPLYFGDAVSSSGSSTPSFPGLPSNDRGCDNSDDYQYPFRGLIPVWRILLGTLIIIFGFFCLIRWGERRWGLALYFCCCLSGVLFGLAPWGKVNDKGQHYCGDKGWFHFSISVPPKYLLTSPNYWGTVIATERTDMANILSTDKQIAVISALQAVRAAIVQEFRSRESEAEA